MCRELIKISDKISAGEHDLVADLEVRVAVCCRALPHRRSDLVDRLVIADFLELALDDDILLFAFVIGDPDTGDLPGDELVILDPDPVAEKASGLVEI